MMQSWTAFAHTGSPAGDGAESAWPCFDSNGRLTRIFDRTSRVEAAPLDAERRAWDGVTP